MTGSMWSGITMTTGTGSIQAIPKGLIATRSIETKHGWVGQVCLAEEIFLEKDGFETSAQAQEWASGKVVAALKKLLGMVADE